MHTVEADLEDNIGLQPESHLNAFVVRAPSAVSLLNDVHRLHIFKEFVVFALPETSIDISTETNLFKTGVGRFRWGLR